MWRDTRGGESTGAHTERVQGQETASKTFWHSYWLAAAQGERIKGSLVLSASLGRLINMCKGHTQRERPSNGSPNAGVPVFQKGHETRSGKYSLEDRAG